MASLKKVIPLGTRGTGQSPQRKVRGQTSSNLAGNSSPFFPFLLSPSPSLFPPPQSSFVHIPPEGSQQGVACEGG